MTETIVVLDPISPERADQLRALLPPGMALTHGRARGDEHMKEIIQVIQRGDDSCTADRKGACKLALRRQTRSRQQIVTLDRAAQCVGQLAM